ncbi:MAG: hypothetical protein J5892_00455 [Bacilli bacterium]|nr:hypothetical protein [Bacilli bacterium]
MSRCFKIYLNGDNNQSVSLSTEVLDNLGAKPDKFYLWEADYLLSGCWSQDDFIKNKVNQFIPFDIKNVTVGTLQTKNKLVCFNDQKLHELTGYLIKDKIDSVKKARIDNCEVGKYLLNKTINRYFEIYRSSNERKVFRALYSLKYQEVESYHLQAVFESSTDLAYECGYQINRKLYGDARERLFNSLKKYDTFRDAYLFLKIYEQDFEKIADIIKDDNITNIKVELNEAKDSYTYSIATSKMGNIRISSNRKFIPNKYHSLEDEFELDEDDIKTLYGDKPTKNYDVDYYGIPADEEEMEKEAKEASNAYLFKPQ